MADQKLNVQLTLDANGMVQGLTVATKGAESAAQAIKQNFRGAADGSAMLSSALRDFKSEATQASRVANFYARDLAEIVPVSGQAQAALRGLFAASVSGGGLAAGFEIALVALRAVNDAIHEQEKEALKLSEVHIQTSADIFKGLIDVQRGLDGDTTSVQKFKQSFADGTTGELVKANKEAAGLLQKSGGIFDFIRYMGDVFLTGKSQSKYTTGISDDIDKAYSAAIARTKEFDGQQGQIAQKRTAENDKLNEKEGVTELLIKAQTQDAITRMESDTAAKVRAIRLQVWGADQSVRERADKEIAAIEADSTTRIARLRQDKEVELSAFIRQSRASQWNEETQLTARNVSTMEKMRVDLSRTTDAELRRIITERANAEVEENRRKIARIQAMEQAQLDAARVNDGRGQYNSKTNETTDLLDEYSKYEIQRDALAAAHNDKRMADELIAVQTASKAQLADVQKFETAGVLTHEQAAAARARAEKTAADETAAVWARSYQRTVSEFIRPLESSFSSAMRSIISGTATVGDAIKQIGLDIVNSVIDGLVKMAGQWATTAIAGVLAANTVAAASLTGAATAATAAKIANTSTTQGNIASAVSGAAASQAFIPLVGPALSIAAASTELGTLEGMTAPLLAASGGFDIPAGINPVTQLHQKEMVLPAHLADPLRDALAGGGLGGGGDVHMHLHAAVIDGASVRAFVQSPEFRTAMTEARRLGRAA